MKALFLAVVLLLTIAARSHGETFGESWQRSMVEKKQKIEDDKRRDKRHQLLMVGIPSAAFVIAAVVLACRRRA